MADIEANGLFNASQSVFNRSFPFAGFFPNESPPQALNPSFNHIIFSVTSAGSRGFVLDPGDPTKVVCTEAGVYLARFILSIPSFDFGTPYCFVEFSVTPTGGTPVAVHQGRAAKKFVQGAVTDYPQSITCEKYINFAVGDALQVSASANPAASVLGASGAGSSSLVLRRVGGVPGPH